MTDQSKGLYCKFDVSRMDNRDRPGHKHHGCEYFVLDLTHDKHAAPALTAYATSCHEEYPELSADLFAKALEMRVLGIAPAVTPLLKLAIDNVVAIERQASAVPKGWKLVPDASHMTDEQAEAIAVRANCCGGIAYDIYRALLEVSPEPVK